VRAVCQVPHCCHPSYAQGYYDRDNPFYIEWDKNYSNPAASANWLDEWVYGVKDRDEYWQAGRGKRTDGWDGATQIQRTGQLWMRHRLRVKDRRELRPAIPQSALLPSRQQVTFATTKRGAYDTDSSPTRVGLLMGVGGLGDQSFNDSAYLGLQALQRQYGIKF